MKYRSTAEGLERERWLMLSHAGGYAGKPDVEALRQLAERVEGLLESEHKEWNEQQQKMLEALVKTQAFVQAHIDETNKRAATAAAARGAAPVADVEHAPPPPPPA